MKKILILVMSCQHEFFVEEEKALKETWAKDIIDGKYPNISLIIYRGGSSSNMFSKKERLLQLNVEDDLAHTFKKTYFAFSMAAHNFSDFDYIFRTNTSTYVNVELLNSYVQAIDNDDIVYTSDICSLSEVHTPYSMCLTARGNGLILSKKLVDIVLKEGLPLIDMECMHDDHGIANTINCYRMKEGKNYRNFLKEYKHGWYKCTITEIDNGHPFCKYNNSSTDFNFWKSFITIQMRNYGDLRDFKCRENEVSKIYEFHEMFSKQPNDALTECVQENINVIDRHIFIGSTLHYVTESQFDEFNKRTLYDWQIRNKANDDPEHEKAHSSFIYVDYFYNMKNDMLI